MAEAGPARLPDLLRYLRGIERRLDQGAGQRQRRPAADGPGRAMAEEYDDTLAALPPARREDAAVRRSRWMLGGVSAQPVRPGHRHRLPGLRHASSAPSTA